MLKFDLPKAQSSIIKVVGVGGGGNNAVNHMFKHTIKDVDFIQCNTDAQALESSPVPTKIQLGVNGLGAGAKPEVGRKAAEESIEQIRALLEKNTQMLFITAGMGGGTGTGAAPVIASIARELDILTVGIVTIPFSFEGRRRKLQAEQGIEELRKYVDTLLIINNDKLRELYGDLKLTEAFDHADNVLTTAAKGIAEIITVKGYVNVDFEDVKTVMKDSGKAIMGSGVASGENRALEAVEVALSSPLLNDSDILGAKNILLYIASGTEEVTMDEVTEITDYIQESAGLEADIIWGTGIDQALEDRLSITLIATGFAAKPLSTETSGLKKTVVGLNDTVQSTVINSPKRDAIEEITLLTPKTEQVTERAKPEIIVHQLETTEVPTLSVPQPDPATSLTEPVLISRSSETAIASEPVLNQSARPDNKAQSIEQTLPSGFNTDRMEARSAERESIVKRQLREMSWRSKNPAALTEMENQPAYQRKNVTLADTVPSSESVVSRFVLTSENGTPEIKNNSYLHDNVD